MEPLTHNGAAYTDVEVIPRMKLYMKHDHYKESSLYCLASPDLLKVKGKKEEREKVCEI